jgi:hypothetical protein
MLLYYESQFRNLFNAAALSTADAVRFLVHFAN